MTIVVSVITIALLIINSEIFFPILIVSFPIYFWVKSGKTVIGQKRTCPHCKIEIDSQATKCPHCQGKIYVWTASKKILLGVIFLIIILVGGLNSGANTPAPVSPAVQILNLKKNAIESFARSYVKDTLKSPSTAKFSYFPSVKEDPKKPNSFEIISDVTSQNSFGAMLTNTWSMKVHYIGTDNEENIDEGTNWKIDEFYFNGEKVS